MAFLTKKKDQISFGLMAFWGFVLLLLTACNDGYIVIDGLNTLSIDNCALFNDGQYRIDNMEDYDNLLDIISSTPDCQAPYILPDIDFAERTVLGYKTEITACTVTYSYEAKAKPSDKKYVFTVKAGKEGACSSLYVNMNWISVPKIPNDFSVEYVLEF